MDLIKRTAYKQMPWKNGLGLTAEIDRFPKGDGSYLWRLSQATVRADGPFSSFPDFDRWLAVWQGDGLFLNEKELRPLKPFHFSGDEAISCRLLGTEVLDVGLIYDRSKVNAEMSLVEGTLTLPESDLKTIHYLFDIESGNTLKIGDTPSTKVARSFLFSIHIK